MKVFILASLFSILLMPYSYAQRSFLNAFKQDFLYRCAGMWTSSKASAVTAYPPLKLDSCTDPEALKEQDFLKLINKTAKDEGVELEFVGKTKLDMSNYTVNFTLAQNPENGIQKAAVRADIDKIFPYAVFDEDIEIRLKGRSTQVEKTVHKLNSLFTPLEISPKYYLNSEVDHLIQKVQDSVNLFTKSIQIGAFLDELSLQDKRRAALHALELSSRYSLSFSDDDISRLQQIVEEMYGLGLELSETDQKEYLDSMRRFFSRSADIESATDLLEKVDPQGILKDVLGEEYRLLASRKYLTSSPVGKGLGRTAESLDLKFVTHQTNKKHYYTITSHPQGKPSLRVSRQNAGDSGELAQRGEGFYAMKGVDSEFHPDYGDYKVVFKVHPDARVGSDFSLYNHEVMFHNLSALEIDVTHSSKAIDPLDYFKSLSLEHPQSDLYRQRISVLSRVLTDPHKRSSIDDLALEVFQGRSVPDDFVQAYLSLPYRQTPQQRQVEEAFLEMMIDGLYEPMRSKQISYFRIWLNYGRYNEYKHIIKNFIDNPLWNGTVFLNENIFGLLETKAIEEDWVIDYIKNSKTYSEFYHALKNIYPSPEVKRLLNLLERAGPDSAASGCRGLMSQFLAG